MLKKYNIMSKKSKLHQGKILRAFLCSSMPSEKLGHNFFFNDSVQLGYRREAQKGAAETTSNRISNGWI